MKMMKKLFVVLAVLALCSAANATAIEFVDAGTTIVAVPGEDVRLDIEQIPTEPGLISMDVIATVTSPDSTCSSITKAMNPTDDPGNPNAYGWDYSSYPIAPIGIGTCVVEVAGATFGCNNYIVIGYIEVGYTGGTQIVSLAAGQGFGGSIDCDFGIPTFSKVVTIIPEPMTIVLLGLGGLLLRRRK